MTANSKLQKNRFSKYRSYTIEDIALVCGKSRKTIERWICIGLAPIDPTKKPYYFTGTEIKRYMQNIKNARKWNMSEGKYLCFRCRKGVQAKEKSIVKNGHILYAKCKNCGGNVCRFIGKHSINIRAP